MKRIFPLMAGLVFQLGVASQAAGEPIVVDQFQLDGSQQNQAIHAVRSVGQTFTVGQAGILQAVEFSLMAQGPGGDLTVAVLDLRGGDLSLAPTLGSVSIPPTALGPFPPFLDLDAVTATRIDLSSLGIAVQEGDPLAIRLTTERALPSLYGIRIALADRYPGGAFFVSNQPLPGSDAAFKTFVASTPVPEPTSLALMAIGLTGIGFLGRRKRQTEAASRVPACQESRGDVASGKAAAGSPSSA